MYSQGRKPLISVNPLLPPSPPLAFYSHEWLRLSGEPAWPKPHHHLQTEVCDACGFCSLPSQSHNTPWEFWSQTISTSPPIPKPVWNCNCKGMEKNFDSDILRINLKLFLPTEIHYEVRQAMQPRVCGMIMLYSRGEPWGLGDGQLEGGRGKRQATSAGCLLLWAGATC